jgi:hypothetical protein
MVTFCIFYRLSDIFVTRVAVGVAAILFFWGGRIRISNPLPLEETPISNHGVEVVGTT